MVTCVFLQFKYNESRYKQCGVTPNFSTGQNLRVVSRIRGAFRTLSNIYDVAFLQKYLRAFSHSEKLKKILSHRYLVLNINMMLPVFIDISFMKCSQNRLKG